MLSALILLYRTCCLVINTQFYSKDGFMFHYTAGTYGFAIALPILVFLVVWGIGLIIPFFCFPKLYVIQPYRAVFLEI